MEVQKLMKSILIIGAGGYGRNIRELAEQCGYDKIDYLDDYNPEAVGKLNEIEEYQEKYDECIIAFGNPDVRESLAKKVRNLCFLIHSRAVVCGSASIARGCIVEANAVVNSNVVIEEVTYVCAGAVINHDATVGACCQIDCNATVASGSKVPHKTKVKSCTVWGS